MYKCIKYADEQGNRCSVETSAHYSEIKIKHIKHHYMVGVFQ